MTRSMNLYTALAALSTFALSGCVSQDAALIDEKDAVEAALTKFSGEVLGVRFDEPDRQWDVFIKTKDQAYEVEVDAVSGKIVAAEKESLEEIQAELSGDLSHEGVDGDVDP